MLTGSTSDLQRFVLFCRMFPFMFIPPVHLSDIFVFGEVIGEPFFISERNEVGDIRTELGNRVYVEMVVVRTALA